MDKLASMRPQDVVVLLFLGSQQSGAKQLRQLDIAYQLSMSQSEMSASLQRSSLCGLLSQDLRTVQRTALMGFLEHGLRYVYPVQPGRMAVGVACAHSDPHFSQRIISSEAYVWPYPDGQTRGVSIQPLILSVPKIALVNKTMYHLLSACDMLRVGRSREVKLAISYLNEFLAERSKHVDTKSA